MQLHPQFVTDETGQRTGVIIPVSEYERLLEALADQLDARELDEAARDETEFQSYSDVQTELRNEGKL